MQKSFFECQVSEMQLEDLARALLAEIDLDEDNLGSYRLTEPHELRIKQYGVLRSMDFQGPLGV